MTTCPHCGKDAQSPIEPGTLTLRPAKVKNLHATSWCPACGKVKGYSADLTFGVASDGDPDFVTVPDMCRCQSFSMSNGNGFNTLSMQGFINL